MRRTTPAGVVWEWDYQPTGELVEARVRGRSTVTRGYRYTSNGKTSGWSDGTFGPATFRHDPDGFLIEARFGNDTPDEFAHDTAGNLLPPRNIRIDRDADGNVIEKTARGKRWQFSYDPFGQLSRARGEGGVEVEFAYDPFGRRVRKAANGCRPVEYVWDGDTILGSESSAPVEYLYRPDTFIPLAQFDPAGTVVFECDPLGLPRSAFTPEGELAWEAEFHPHGGIRDERGDAGRVALRYPGQIADSETGLLYNRFRYLDPEARMYVSPDPAGLCGGLQPYNYTIDPLAQIDPYGLSCGTLPPGAKVLKDASPSHIVYELPNGEKRIRFKADEAVTLKDANPGRNYTVDSLAGVDPHGRPYVHEGRHRAIGASQGATVPENLGGVPSAPGYLDYEFSSNTAPGGGVPVKNLTIDNSMPDMDKNAAVKAYPDRN